MVYKKFRIFFAVYKKTNFPHTKDATYYNRKKKVIFMFNDDSVRLLRECDAGSKMAISSIDEILEKVKDCNLKNLLTESKDHHEKLRNDIERLLCEHEIDEKEPQMMAKGMSWIKTNMKLAMDNSDATIADLITDGCNMGVKSLNMYLNQYPTADSSAKDICRRLIDIEEKLCEDLKKYL